jgi:hypothetical protein
MLFMSFPRARLARRHFIRRPAHPRQASLSV